MVWDKVNAIATAFMALIILVTVLFAAFQLRENQKYRKATAFIGVYEFLQEEYTCKSRGILISLLKSKKNFKEWSKKEIEACEKVCKVYNFAGIMVSKKLVEKDLIVNEWRNSIIMCWEAAKPMLAEYRKSRGEEYWYNFDKLYEMAKKRNAV